MDQVERYSLIFELEMSTRYSRNYLENLSDEELKQLYKERCQPEGLHD